MAREPQWMRDRRLGKEPPNPLARKRRRNQSARYLTEREKHTHHMLLELNQRGYPHHKEGQDD